MLSAIVLAAGLSSRMGEHNKLLLPYKTNSVIAEVIAAIIAAGVEEVIVVTGHESAKITERLKGSELRFAYNARFGEGMTSSIQQGILASNGNGYMICLSDMVTITADEYTVLAGAFQQQLLSDPQCIIIPRYRNETGNPVIFSALYREAILQNQQQDGCRNIVQANRAHVLMVEMNTPHILQDIDYPEDYKQFFPPG